jgi:hypothetical protein
MNPDPTPQLPPVLPGFNLNKYFEENQGSAPYPRIICADGFSMSVQASQYGYCSPREDRGPWYKAEVGFPSAKEESLMEYCEDSEKPTETVYGYVPVEIIEKIVDSHGGIALANGIGVVPSKSGPCVDKQGNSLIEAGDEVENNEARFFADLTSGYLVGIDKTKPWSLKNESSKMAECIRQGNYACHSMKLTFVEPLPSAPVGEPDGIQSKLFGEVWVACHVGKGVSCIGKTEDDAIRGVRDALETHESPVKETTSDPCESEAKPEAGRDEMERLRQETDEILEELKLEDRIEELKRELAAANSELERNKRTISGMNEKYGELVEELSQANAAVGNLRDALGLAREAIGDHFAPNDCYSTGPLTGDPIRDLVCCPACAFIASYESVNKPTPTAPDGWRKEPPPGLLMSMAMRMDHAIGCPGYYDQEIFRGKISHADRLRVLLNDMRKVWEEVVGQGFYKPELESKYTDMLPKPPTGKGEA